MLRAGLHLILCRDAENQPPRQQHYLRMLMEKRVNGLLVLGTDIDTPLRDMLRIHQTYRELVLDWDPERRSCQRHQRQRPHRCALMRHLLEQGHRDIVSSPVSWPADHQAAAGRGARCPGRAGLTLKSEQIFEEDAESQSGFDAMQRILGPQAAAHAVLPSTIPWRSAPSALPGKPGSRLPDDISHDRL